MRVIIFGLTVSSSWGNGHATLWRSLIKAMVRRGHLVTFYEKNTPYYAGARDLDRLPDGSTLRIYEDFASIRGEVGRELDGADLALCTSFCPDGSEACELILHSGAGIKAFYDLDTPVTLESLRRGDAVGYLPEGGLGDFDLVLSFTGGRALSQLQTRLNARRVEPLYGSVDPEQHHPVAAEDQLRSTLSYLGTYASDRQEALERLFLQAAKEMPNEWFLIGGAQYPSAFPWGPNVGFVRHVPPQMHARFFCSGRATLNVTRGVMAQYGFCPSGRMFEAAACGVPLLTDGWEGLDTFFTPGKEITLVQTTRDVVRALTMTDAELGRMARQAREKVLAQHTGDCRVRELEQICGSIHPVYA